MARNDLIKRNVQFSVINMRYKNKPAKIQDVFNFINKLDFNNGDRYHETSEGINLTVFLDNPKLPIRGLIGDSRKKALPMIETIGRRQGLVLPSRSSGLFDGNHFIIFENQYGTIIMAHEFNFYAPRIARLAQYIMVKCGNIADHCTIEPIQKQDIKSILKNIKFPRYFEIRAHKSCSFLSLDKSLHNAFASMANVTDADYYNVSFSCKRGRKNPLSMKNFSNIYPFMKTPDARDLLEKFYIEYIDPTDGQKKSEDLTNLFLNEYVYVAQIDKDHRSVDTYSMYKALDGSIEKHYNLLDGIQT